MEWAVQNLKEWREALFFGSLILALAFVLRAANIALLPIFADEAIYVRWAQVMRVEPSLRFLPLTDGKAPLFMWSIIPMLKIFDNPLIAGRAVSVLTGILSTGGIFALTFILFENKRLGLIAALLYAVSPFTVFFDRMALVDSMLSMFGIWTFVFALLAMKYGRWDMAILSGFALGGAALTKAPALFFALLLPLTVLFAKKVRLVQSGFYLLTTWGMGLAMYNILRLGPNFHLLNSRNQDYVFPLSHVFENPLDPLVGFLARTAGWFIDLGPVVIIALVAGGALINYKKYWKQVLVLVAWAVVPIVAQAEFARVFTARYILFTTPAVIVLAAISAVPIVKKVSGKLKLKQLHKLIQGTLGIFVLHSLFVDYQIITSPQAAPLPANEREGYLEEWTAGVGIPEAVDIIKARHAQDPDTPIVVGAEGFFGTPFDAFQAYLNDKRNITVIGVPIDLGEMPESLLDSRDSGNVTYLAINSSRLKIDPEEFGRHGLEVVLSVKKPERTPGSHGHTKHGPRDTFYLFEVK